MWKFLQKRIKKSLVTVDAISFTLTSLFGLCSLSYDAIGSPRITGSLGGRRSLDISPKGIGGNKGDLQTSLQREGPWRTKGKPQLGPKQERKEEKKEEREGRSSSSTTAGVSPDHRRSTTGILPDHRRSLIELPPEALTFAGPPHEALTFARPSSEILVVPLLLRIREVVDAPMDALVAPVVVLQSVAPTCTTPCLLNLIVNVILLLWDFKSYLLNFEVMHGDWLDDDRSSTAREEFDENASYFDLSILQIVEVSLPVNKSLLCRWFSNGCWFFLGNDDEDSLPLGPRLLATLVVLLRFGVL
ncbi:hypothetical protein MA16_Dca015294 [Dendrobium catenatum]|uniref:Uncharacterized protein n=1 Tax=Dendrobium catenatum TaxID=906689 RepID=A0A2I0X024_9ASPA|nr:hypothetical protein MA16_Dca015294 [Dendrobium catenatum]